MTDRTLVAQQIGSWLPAADEHQFAQRSKFALAEAFPIETLYLGSESSSTGRRFVSENLELHLIRDERGKAVSYARTRADEQATLLSLTNRSELPELIDQGLAKLTVTGAEYDGVSIVLQQSISLAALRLHRDGENMICLLRIEGRETGTPVALMSADDLFDIASRASADRRDRSKAEVQPDQGL
ncbi:hypothetical protein [Sphingomonas bacterium]|uniref:hypothetical protein n=1 Tax=Sphingomonas bacterium TaxID=1895847 RepID=UPI0015761590|nr:hypothetical protein [Sphingomonas bacterium]